MTFDMSAWILRRLFGGRWAFRGGLLGVLVLIGVAAAVHIASLPRCAGGDCRPDGYGWHRNRWRADDIVVDSAGRLHHSRQGNPVVMDSSTFGLPKNSRLGYREIIYYASRISTDGIYLHQLDATVWAQGNTDTPHGCLNLNADNAKWFYDFSVPGDIVEIRTTGGPPLQLHKTVTGRSLGLSGPKAVP
jgi:hypothetical protein